ncbi:MAG: patatin-like phospholipase family protein [Pseudomonadota bacterium]
MFESSKKRLLALDGGGILGVITLGALRKMEADIQNLPGKKDARLGDFFDYIAGTSTGAIIAAGLAMGKSVAEIETIYVDEGPEIFKKKSLFSWLLGGTRHFYAPEALTSRLKREFTEHTIAELQASGQLPTDKHLLVVTRNATTDSPWPISTNPKAKYNDLKRSDSNLNLPLWRLVRASSAAPTFFPPEELQWDPENDKSAFMFEDGGVTPYNNPSQIVFRMATEPAYRCGWPTGEDKMMLVSVGTSYAYRTLDGMNKGGENILKTASTIPSELMRGIAVENDIACRTLGRCVAGGKIDSEIGTMIPGPKEKTNRAFLYARYDLETDADSLDELGLGDIDPASLTLDNIDAIPDMVRLGRKLAEQVDLPKQFPDFVK